MTVEYPQALSLLPCLLLTAGTQVTARLGGPEPRPRAARTRATTAFPTPTAARAALTAGQRSASSFGKAGGRTSGRPRGAALRIGRAAAARPLPWQRELRPQPPLPSPAAQPSWRRLTTRPAPRTGTSIRPARTRRGPREVAAAVIRRPLTRSSRRRGRRARPPAPLLSR